MFSGLANGPVFKTFSYRQVSLTGAIVVFISLMLTTFSYNFMTYLISFSILYGNLVVHYIIDDQNNASKKHTINIITLTFRRWIWDKQFC